MTRLGLSREEQVTIARLTAEDRRDMLRRALAICPDLSDDEAVMVHLHGLGFRLTEIDVALAEMVDEARGHRCRDPFVSLGELAARVVANITPST